MEIWRSVKGYEGMYEVSTYGNVRSVSRKVPHKRHGFVSVKSKVLKPATDTCGYFRVALSNTKNSLCTKKVHRLVAESFVDGDNSLEVHHVDGDKKNNHVTNLKWVTRSQNIKENYNLGIQKPLKGESNGNSKLTEEQVKEIRLSYKPYEFGYKKLADKYGVDKKTIIDIVKFKIWK
jgi:hypothetical protein